MNGQYNRWTPSMARVWVAETNPVWSLLPLGERARRARLSRSHYKEILSNPELQEAIVRHVRQALMEHRDFFADSLLVNMALPGREGFRDREMYGKITGIVPDPRVKVDHAGTVKHELEVGTGLMAALRLARAAEARLTDPPQLEHAPPVIDNDEPTDAN